jgi:hypothetical protein
MPKLSGTIYRYGSEERIQYATVKAWSKGKKPTHTFADDDGDFNFDDLEPGKWTILALDENSLPGDRFEVELIEDRTGIKVELQRLAETLDLKKGRNFFIGLLASLGVLVVVYVLLHGFIKIGTDPQAETFIWTEGAWRFLELFMWSLAGILVNKIINIGWYLRSGRFYREGMMIHIAHLATTPLLVLVAVVILSLASLTLSLANNNEITLDLSDPNIMIAIAFLLGTSPWPLWRFIEDTAKRVTGQ